MTNTASTTSSSASQYYCNIPLELRERDQWLNWTAEPRDGGKMAKVPRDAKSGGLASVADPATWGTFVQAVANVDAGRCSGIGYVFAKDDPYCGIDIDDPGDDIEARARNERIIEAFDSYTETSPSGRGYHIIIKAVIPHGRRRANVEMYSDGRFFTMTGKAVRHADI